MGSVYDSEVDCGESQSDGRYHHDCIFGIAKKSYSHDWGVVDLANLCMSDRLRRLHRLRLA